MTDWCKRCVVCSRRKGPAPKNQAALQPIKVGYPLQIVATDILGPLPKSKNGNMYVLVVSDYLTRWAEAYAIPNQEAETVAKKLTNEMFCRFSIPDIRTRVDNLNPNWYLKCAKSAKHVPHPKVMD